MDNNNELWSVLLKLALELKRICEKYQLKYFLHAGSLLGAIRHNGFIPWDDDMDFVMPRSDYEKFLQVAANEIKPPFYLQTLYNSGDIFNNGRTVLRMDGTTGVQHYRDLYSKGHQGIAIDIAALDNCPDDAKLRNKQWKDIDKWAGMLFLKKYGKNLYKLSVLDWGEIKTIILCNLSKLIPDKVLVDKLNQNTKKFNNINCSYYASNSEAFGNYRHIVLDKSLYKKVTMMKFEDYLFPAPLGYDEILKKYYGENYMLLPPVNERNGHHNVVIDTEKSYKDVLKHYQEIFKNTEGKKIVVFGAGKMFEHYLANVDKKYYPLFIVDNDKNKWNTKINDFKVCSPQEILKIPKEEQYIVICSVYYKEIIKQLKDMKIENYFVYVQDIKWL